MSVATALIRNQASFPTSTLVIAKRSMLKFVRTPQLVVLETVQGALFLLIFRYVFGGAIGIEGVSYVDFLIPGFVTTSMLFSGMTAAAGVAEDLEQGFVDRLRSLPIPRSAVLAGRVLADTASVSWGLLLTTVVGFAVGFRLTGSVGEGLAAFALMVLFGFALGWVFLTIGLVAGNAQAAQGMSLLLIPFTFVSSAFVPIESMPGWLQAIGERQPITFMVESVRALTLGGQAEAVLGHDAGYFVLRALLWSAAIIFVFGALAVARYRRA